MNKLNKKEKKLEKVEIPSKLFEFLKFVQDLITEGDEVTTIPTDDSIQNDDASGGLNDDLNTFDFTYYLGDTPHSTWDLQVTKEDIKEISEGSIKELSLWACQQSNCLNKAFYKDFICLSHDWEDELADEARKIFNTDNVNPNS